MDKISKILLTALILYTLAGFILFLSISVYYQHSKTICAPGLL